MALMQQWWFQGGHVAPKFQFFLNRDFTYILQQFSLYYVTLIRQLFSGFQGFLFIILSLLTFIVNMFNDGRVQSSLSSDFLAPFERHDNVKTMTQNFVGRGCTSVGRLIVKDNNNNKRSNIYWRIFTEFCRPDGTKRADDDQIFLKVLLRLRQLIIIYIACSTSSS